jgi:hypothetical protein
MTTTITTSTPTTSPDFAGGYFYLDNNAQLHQQADFLERFSEIATDSLDDDFQAAVYQAQKLADGQWIRLDTAQEN